MSNIVEIKVPDIGDFDSVEVIDQRVFPDKSAVGDTVLNCLIKETRIYKK